MAGPTELLQSLRNEIAGLRSRIIGLTAYFSNYSYFGEYVQFGCGVTGSTTSPQGYDVHLSGQASGDEARHNPDYVDPPEEPFQYPNIAGTKTGPFYTLDLVATVSAPPATGLGRYDIAYIFLGTSGAGFAIASGTPHSDVKDDFDNNGLDTSPYGEAAIDDPDLPVGAMPVARIYVEDVFSGIQNARIADLRNFYIDAIAASSIAAAIHAASTKSTPVDADEFGFVDSAASWVIKKLSWSNIKATLKTYFDTVYQPIDATLTALAGLTIAANSLSIGTGADAFTQTSFAANTFPARASTGNLVAKTITDDALALLDDVGFATMRATLGLTIGTHVQAYSSVLSATTASFLTAHETKLGHITVTQAVDLDAIETRVNDLDAAVVLRGTWDASAGTFPGGGTAQAGSSYIVSVAGTVDSVPFAVGDRAIAITDNASTTTFAANWFKADYTDQVLSVAGRTGAVTLAQADVSGLTTADSPQFAAFNVGHASDTTITRASAGVIAVEGVNVLLASNIGSSVQAFLVSGTNIKTVNGSSLLGSGDLTVGGGAITIANKTANYTITAADIGKIINVTSNSVTISLDPAATLGSGFYCWVTNSATTATHATTIDPSSSETIDGMSARVLRRGEGIKIVSNGTNIESGDLKAPRGYAENISVGSERPVASGNKAIAIGPDLAGAATTASGLSSIAIVGQASATNAVAIGGNSGDGLAISTGNASLALMGSRAAGTDSLAAMIKNTTTTYGAKHTSTFAFGDSAVASSPHGIALASFSTTTNGIALGYSANASGSGAVCIVAAGVGWNGLASGRSAVAIGDGAAARESGKFAFSSGACFGAAGDAQAGKMVIAAATTDATPKVATSYNYTGADATNQLTLPNNSAYSFRIRVNAMQKAGDGTNTADYEFVGQIRRGSNAASTAVKFSNKTVLFEDDAAWDCDVSADTTNGSLAVTVTGKAATNIRWVIDIETVEVTYA